MQTAQVTKPGLYSITIDALHRWPPHPAFQHHETYQTLDEAQAAVGADLAWRHSQTTRGGHYWDANLGDGRGARIDEALGIVGIDTSKWPRASSDYWIAPVQEERVMTQRLEDRWAARDLPTLVAAARLIDDRPHFSLQIEDIAAASGFSLDDTTRAVVSLMSGYLDVDASQRGLGGQFLLVRGLTERGRRAVGLWPSGRGVDALVDALRQAEQAVDDPEEKSLLRKAASAAMGISREVTTDILAAVIKAQTGL
jgi:hypothetical protein